MEFRKDCKYAIACPTSMGVRITPINGQSIESSDTYKMQATSAESNVLSIAAGLGEKTLVMTSFVKNDPIAEFIKRNLRSRGMDYVGREVEKGDPWGYRHQFNIAERGYGTRGPRVANDRSGEVGRTMSIEDFDLDKIFGEEGVKILHLSGLIAALSPTTSKLCVALAEKAKEYGTKISFDLNYRASFWKGREGELSAAFKRIAELSDILVGNEEDYQLCLGLKGPEAGGKDLSSKIDSFKEMILTAAKEYPNVSVFATTLRQVISTNQHLWGAISYDGEKFTVVEPTPIYVYDRIGGGDGFVGGLLYSLALGNDVEYATKFGRASGAYVATLETDYGLPANIGVIESIMAGDARVKR